MRIKSFYCVLFFLLVAVAGRSQKSEPDSIHKLLQQTINDSVRYDLLHRLYSYFEETQKDSALGIIRQMHVLAEKNRQHYTGIVCLGGIGYELMGLGKYSESLTTLLKAKELSQDSGSRVSNSWSVLGGTLGNEPPVQFQRQTVQAYIYHLLGNLMWNTGNLKQSLFYFHQARKIGIHTNNQVRRGMACMNIGRCYIYLEKLDSAYFFEKEAEGIALQNFTQKYVGHIFTYLGDIAYDKGEYFSALPYYYRAIEAGKLNNNLNSITQAYFSITRYYLGMGNVDSSLFFARRNIAVINSLGSSFTLIHVNIGSVFQQMLEAYQLSGNKDSIAKYQAITLHVKDSLAQSRIRNLTDFQNALIQNQLRLQSLEKQKLISDNRNRAYFFIGGIIFVVAVSLLLFRSNRIKQRDNRILQKTLEHLKATQTQLIQSEKMASLGELTAGIAHEIQNPLNFVNNFSEVNKELLAELKDEIEKGNLDEVRALADDLMGNEEKISHHGKRADAIVKGMLQHSRTGSGQKELTDINALADEYLRLAYHGLKAKDPSFHASFHFEPDETMPKVNVVPQDIGRVFLNLINNAFQAVNEYCETPQVSVSIHKRDNFVEVVVADNGPGIPEAIRDKIFQPFFTTKPTGQGTGLGLSLSYDIVKAHGGELKVETKEARPPAPTSSDLSGWRAGSDGDDPVGRGEGSTFTIQLPMV